MWHFEIIMWLASAYGNVFSYVLEYGCAEETADVKG